MHTSRYATQCEVLMYYHEFRFLEQLEKTVGVVVQILRKCRLRLAVAIERRLRQRRRRACHLYDTHTRKRERQWRHVFPNNGPLLANKNVTG